MSKPVIVAAVRTPMCKNGGSLAPIRAEELGAIVVKEAVKRARINPEDIDECIFSCVANTDIKNVARVVWLQAGMPLKVPAFQLDRACSSSMTGLYVAANMIIAGTGKCYVVGGVESCSNRPYTMDRIKSPYQYQPPSFSTLRISPDNFGNLSNGETAEVVAERFHITREDCDRASMISHKRASAAWNKHRFDEHIVPVTVPQRKKDSVVVNRDEIYRADCSMESLAKLRGAFRKDGIVTAGNSSPLTDGASCCVIMAEEYARELGCEILGTYKDFITVGLEPEIMGMGPYYAIREILKRNQLDKDDIDLYEINEAFASQYVACMRELGLDEEKVNVNGGAIAVGHPFGASGGILTARILYELKRRGAKRGIVAFCIGGGLGAAMLVEREEE